MRSDDAPSESPDTPVPGNYPERWEADVVLRDGTLAHVRPIVPADAAGVRRFHDAQSEESIYLRFFAPVKHLSEADVFRFTNVDYDERVALVATIGGDIIGIARYDRLSDRTQAEVAFNISDHYQGKGVGSVLLEHLAVIARENGVARFVADVLPQNRKMMRVFTDAGYEVSRAFDEGIVSVSFTIEPTGKSQGVQLDREHRAEARSMSRVLAPGSVVVVGASRRPDCAGTILLDNILDAGFTGPVHVVTDEDGPVRGIRAFRRVSDLGQGADLAVIAGPASRVLDVVDDCGRSGVHTVLVVSDGFAEAGPGGEARQAELLRRARRYGMRVVGPCSFGMMNNDPSVRLDATLASASARPGGLGIFSQSAGLGASLLASVTRSRIGVSCFLSAGNRVDVSGNDLMQFLIDDDATTAVALYLESVGNARKFSRIARQLSLRKPVVCVKSPSAGTVPPGHRARTTTLPSGAFEAMLGQAGVIRAENIHDLTVICQLLTGQPLPSGNRLAFVANSPGLVAILAEEAARHGLVIGRDNPFLPVQCTVGQVSAMAEESLADEAVDALVVCLVPPLGGSEDIIAQAIAHAAAAEPGKPVVATFIGMRDTSAAMRKAGRSRGPGRCHVVPAYPAPLDAVRALGAAAGYARWLASGRGEQVRPDGIDRAAALAVVHQVLDGSPHGRELTSAEATALLAAAGVEPWPAPVAGSADEAVTAAAGLGYPVVLRPVREDVRDRPAGGAVRMDLADAAGVRQAYASLREAYGPHVRVVVQRRAEPGTALSLRTTEDPVFGPVLSLGLAGPPSELLGDVVYRIPPLSDADIAGMVAALRCAPLLDGTCGPAIDQEALADLVARVSVLADLVPQIASLRLEPVSVRPGGADVLGARIVLAPAGARTDAGRRALT